MVFSFVPCFEGHTALEGGCADHAAERGRGHVSTSCSRWLGVQHPPPLGVGFQEKAPPEGVSGGGKHVSLVSPPLSSGGFVYHEKKVPSRCIGM